ncbi:hypothetical protein DIE16_07605 [Burkholderia sp. Bp9090]|nr:hypothetical protein DIE16_07605 [Burkholderia sp. Bp9090]
MRINAGGGQRFTASPLHRFTASPLHAARCTLHAARCTLHAARCTLHAARCARHTAHGTRREYRAGLGRAAFVIQARAQARTTTRRCSPAPPKFMRTNSSVTKAPRVRLSTGQAPTHCADQLLERGGRNACRHDDPSAHHPPQQSRRHPLQSASVPIRLCA